MTESEIDNLEAGPKTDVLVAERVMGWKVISQHTSPTGQWPYRTLEDPSLAGSFCPSTNISAAWEVVEKLVETDEALCYALEYDGRLEEYRFLMRKYEEILTPGYWPWAATAPLAICRSALKSIKEAPND